MSEEREPGTSPEPPSDETDGAGASTEDDEERVRRVVDELRRLKVEDLALDMAVSLVTVGYQKLGLTEQTRELRDLDGARLSIELLHACLDVLERERGASGLGDLRGTLSAMQLNFARVVAEEQGEGAVSGAEPEPGGTAESAAKPEPDGTAEPEADPEPGAGRSAGE
jgi:hypothetical protein